MNSIRTIKLNIAAFLDNLYISFCQVLDKQTLDTFFSFLFRTGNLHLQLCGLYCSNPCFPSEELKSLIYPGPRFPRGIKKKSARVFLNVPSLFSNNMPHERPELQVTIAQSKQETYNKLNQLSPTSTYMLNCFQK